MHLLVLEYQSENSTAHYTVPFLQDNSFPQNLRYFLLIFQMYCPVKNYLVCIQKILLYVVTVYSGTVSIVR